MFSSEYYSLKIFLDVGIIGSFLILIILGVIVMLYIALNKC